MAEESFLTNETYTSQLFSSLYYAKKSLKTLLQQRSNILLKLNFKPQRGSFQDVTNSVLLLFNEYPLTLQASNLLVLRDSNIYFIFFSTDYKFIPHCKLCNVSVYVTVINNIGKIICCDAKCKRVVLQEFEIKKKGNTLNSKLSSQNDNNSKVILNNSHNKGKSNMSSSVSVAQNSQTLQNKEDILKTIQKIFK